MTHRIGRNFFTRPTLEVCRDILGKYLVHKIGKKKLVGKIVEVEAYIGPNDRASHAVGGKMTERNRAEFLEGGHVYIYLVYGMYWQFNVSTEKRGSPECFLIRALEPIEDCHSEGAKRLKNLAGAPPFAKGGTTRGSFRFHRNSREIPPPTLRRGRNDIVNLANGPGKLCRWMRLDKKHYGLDLTKSKELWFESGDEKIPAPKIVRAKRIGIDYAGKYWASRKWRFYIKDNKFVSRPQL